MSVNSVTFVAPNLAWGEARGGSIPRQWGCDRRATKPQAKFGATLRAAVLFGPGCVARSLQIRVGYALVPVRKHLAPCRGRKLLAANVTEFTLLTTKLCGKTATPGGFDALRLVLRTQTRSGKFARPATIPRDTDRSRSHAQKFKRVAWKLRRGDSGRGLRLVRVLTVSFICGL